MGICMSCIIDMVVIVNTTSCYFTPMFLEISQIVQIPELHLPFQGSFTYRLAGDWQFLLVHDCSV